MGLFNQKYACHFHHLYQHLCILIGPISLGLNRIKAKAKKVCGHRLIIISVI